MEFFKLLFDQSPEVMYMLSIVLMTYLVLKFIFKSPTENQKRGTCIIVGIVLGVAYYLCTDFKEIMSMVLALLAASTFYD